MKISNGPVTRPPIQLQPLPAQAAAAGAAAANEHMHSRGQRLLDAYLRQFGSPERYRPSQSTSTDEASRGGWCSWLTGACPSLFGSADAEPRWLTEADLLDPDRLEQLTPQHVLSFEKEYEPDDYDGELMYSAKCCFKGDRIDPKYFVHIQR